jgi:hypothetical protein
MQKNPWARLLAYVTGRINQELLLKNEYLAAENRILREHGCSGTRPSGQQRSITHHLKAAYERLTAPRGG